MTTDTIVPLSIKGYGGGIKVSRLSHRVYTAGMAEYKEPDPEAKQSLLRGRTDLIYEEPELTYLVLDFLKEPETRRCLESVKTYTKFPHKVIYLHNGRETDYPKKFLDEGLFDQLI